MPQNNTPAVSDTQEKDLLSEAEPMIRRLARKHGRHSEIYEDLLQVGREAALKAARRFDASSGVPFCGFAFMAVAGSMLSYIEKQSPLERRVQSKLRRLNKTIDRYYARYGCSPSHEMLRELTGLDTNEIHEILLVGEFQPCSLDDMTANMSSADSADASAQVTDIIKLLKATLGNERDANLAFAIFIAEVDGKSLAAEHGVSEARISQLKTSLQKQITQALRPSNDK
jgi:RNA polymerase sigma factor (sigma-70 family)